MQALCDVVDIEACNVDGSVKGAVHGMGSMALQEIVEHVNLANPITWISMDGFREELDSGLPGVEEVLAFEVAFAAFARECGQLCGAMLGKGGLLLAAVEALMHDPVPARDDLDSVPVKVEGGG